MSQSRNHVAIIGGGPGGYEAALVAAQLGADVTVVEENGLGGSCVLTDCVPSKTLIATASLMAAMDGTRDLGITFDREPGQPVAAGRSHARADAPRIYSRIRDLAHAQSGDVATRLGAEGVRVIIGRGRLAGPGVVAVGDTEIRADTVLLATCGGTGVLPAAVWRGC